MSIERELQKNYQEVFYPPQDIQVAAGPTETTTDVNQPAFNMPGMGKRSQKSEVGQNLPVVAADVAAGAGKGLISGIAGFAGDIEALYQGVKGLINRGGDESALNAFLTGMAKQTIAPTSDEVSKWLDTNVGPVVPAGANMSPEMMSARRTGANVGEFAGQMVADPFAAVGAGKALVKGVKALPKNLPVGMSTEAVGGMEGVLYPAKATAQPSDIGFYSAVEQAALNIQRKSGTGQAMLNDITKGENVKADEIKWIGLDDFLKGKKNVTREEVQQFIAANKVDVQEVQLGNSKGFTQQMQDRLDELEQLDYRRNDAQDVEYQNLITAENMASDATGNTNQTKFEQFTLPGGENYREILLTMPDNTDPQKARLAFEQRMEQKYGSFNTMKFTDAEKAESESTMQAILDNDGVVSKGQVFKSSHWEQPNVLAHIRVNDRIDADGKKMLLVEEVQSDWHQAGRDKGYRVSPSEDEIQRIMDSSSYMNRADAIDYLTNKNAVPDAPMKDTWYQLALKRVLKYAADNGYERVGLTTGSRQAERYDLSKQVEAVSYHPDDKGRGMMLNVFGKNNEVIYSKLTPEDKVADVIGKDVAKKLLATEPVDDNRVLQGLDLQVGGEGMKKYYDEIYPQFLAKYGKKWGAKVGETSIETDQSPKSWAYFRDWFAQNHGDVGGSSTALAQWKSGEKSKYVREFLYKNKTQEPIRYVDITPEMRQGVGKGQPLFSATGLATGAGAGTMTQSQQEPK